MSATDSQMQTWAALGTVVLVCAVSVPMAFVKKAEAQAGPSLDDMQAIEASIAYKKSPPKQPQKPKSAPVETQKPDGVSHDENKKPDDKKPDDKKPDKDPDLSQFHHASDDDNEKGKPDDKVGDFNGQEYGFAEETKGDPFFQGIAKDIHEAWEYPQILNAAGVPVGCLHVGADGKIPETLLRTKSGDESLDDSVERALKKVKKARDDNPQPVPTYLLKAATTKWVCFKFNLTPQQ